MAENALIERARLRALVGAGIALSSELSLDDLLRRLVESAAALTGARYVTLAMIDSGGHGLERHIAYGTDDDVCHVEDERLAGSSSDPPASSRIDVPVILRGVVHGNLILREKAGGGRLRHGGRRPRRPPGRPGCGRDRERSPVRGVSALD